MNATLISALSSAAIVTLVVQNTMAQSSPTPISRAAVKAETRAAEKAGQLVPAGEGVSPVPKPQPKSSYTRSERKSATIQARKSGALVPAGDAAQNESLAKQESKTKSSKTRTERKAETLAARKAGQLIPAGERPYPAR